MTLLSLSGYPPALANYTPPSRCSSKFSKIVFELTATCKGRQFDRIFGVWLGGVELLRSSTAEPRTTGIVWSVQKDVTTYYSLFAKNETQTLVVYLGNLVNNIDTAVYLVDITLFYYREEVNVDPGESASEYGSMADLILPIPRNLQLNDGLWFEIQKTDIVVKEFMIPQNAFRAVLEV